MTQAEPRAPFPALDRRRGLTDRAKRRHWNRWQAPSCLAPSCLPARCQRQPGVGPRGHRAAGVQLVGADADLGTHAELAAVGEARRDVDADAAAYSASAAFSA